MSKRKVQFRENELEELTGTSCEPSARRFKTKHSLDSDEEDNNDDDEVTGEKYRLKSEDLEGQEETTITHDGDIKITPFNLNEEMEDGYFDAEGNYFENDEKEVHDEWLDSAEFQQIHEFKNDEKMEQDTEQFADAEESIDRKLVLPRILDILKPRETVTKAIKRLGATGSGFNSASARLKAKKNKLKNEGGSQEESEQNKEDKKLLLELTGLADQLLQIGDFYIYQENYEQLSKRFKTLEETEEDDELEAAYSKKDSKKSLSETESHAVLDDVQWQYKWENKDGAEIYGPFSSSQMLEWQQQDYFKDDVWVRKIADHETPFYNSKRIDFELYV